MQEFNLDLNKSYYRLRSLRSEGYFVSITPHDDHYIVECRIYITDKDDETGTINILEVPEALIHKNAQLQNENEICLGCKSIPGEVRELTRGCISCPLSCGSFTRPFALTEKIYKGRLGSDLTISGMPSQMASVILAVLKG
ncbi:MAG: hypothetical protein EB127_24930 [Alphaproteobacteria bacterium]|nr:hypothetical protein [Alphaproteobacteria bacterium]